MESNQISCQDDLYEISKSLLTKIGKEVYECKLSEVKNGEIRLKIKCKFLNKMCIVGNIFIKSGKLEK